MAYVVPRRNADGEITSYQVKWRAGGRGGENQSERFDDEISAELFKQAVDAAGQNWPPGWVKGKGYIDQAAEAEDEERYVFANYARESVMNRTGVEDRYRDASLKELERYVLPTFGNCDVRSPKHFSKRTISAWVRELEQTMVWRGAKHKPMSPKTIKNLHGLLSSILKEATQEEPPLRARNPCELTRLPRVDDGGVEDDGTDEDMNFLLPQDVEAIAQRMPNELGARLVRDAYATGARWGELTALAKRHVYLDRRDGKPKIRISRAWKRRPNKGGYYLGKPKTKRSRRTIRITASTWQGYQDAGLDALNPGDLVYRHGKTGRLPYATFYDWWVTAVRKAHADGALPEDHHPTFHDLRHSHAAALLSAGHGLTYVQRRLGHESITTTSDRYGHLLPESDDSAMATLERALGNLVGEVVEAAPVTDERRVFVLRFGARLVGWWDVAHARAVAEQWELDRGVPVAVEAWSEDWWIRSVPGGLPKVRSAPADRVSVWYVGPTTYSAEGTEIVRRSADQEPRSTTVWEWEPRYTSEPVVTHTEWRPDGTTIAEAWGYDRDAVLVGYAEAKSDALRVCGLNPSRADSTHPA